MPLRAVVDTRALREAAKIVREVDPEIRKGFIRDLKADLKPYAASIAGDVPMLGQPGNMRGWAHDGRTKWSKVRTGVYVTPGGGKGSLARIEIFGTGAFKAALKYADLAGTRNDYNDGNQSNNGKRPTYRINGQGRAMVQRLNEIAPLSEDGKGGRFVWSGFMKYRPTFVKQAIKRLDEYSEAINKKIGR